jgi:hypothetical protein
MDRVRRPSTFSEQVRAAIVRHYSIRTVGAGVHSVPREAPAPRAGRIAGRGVSHASRRRQEGFGKYAESSVERARVPLQGRA